MGFERLDKTVQEKLGHALRPGDKGSIPSLNHIPLSLVADARKLENVGWMMDFIAYHVPEGDEPYVRAFVFQVVMEGEDPTQWRRGGVLAPMTSLEDQMTTSIAELYGDWGDGFRHIVRPYPSLWKGSSCFAGCFAFPDPERTYRFTVPKGFVLLDASTELVETSPEAVPILFRRWIAQRIASYLWSIELLRHPVSRSALEEIAKPRFWTNDAQKAIAGLDRELQQGLDLEHTVPGYVGEDAWYE